MMHAQAFVNMSAKGSFSYKNTTINGFNVNVNGTPMQIRVEAVNNNVARIYMTNADGNEQPLPNCIVLRDSMNVAVPPFNHSFFITWIDSYALSVAGVEVIWMTSQKQQAFRTAESVTHFTVQM